jgi:peptide deformylase
VPYNFFIAIKDIGFEYFVNCSYDGIGEKINYLEGCLSLRNDDGTLKQYEVLRFPKIKLKGKKLVVSLTDPTLILIDVDEEVSGFKCIICQHEIDHANGILISQIGKQISIHRS